MSFDESKVQRDDHGRFTGGGLGGWVAKNTGQLKGYEPAPKGDLSKWTAAKISGRQRDVEVPLISKMNGDFASTGDLPMNAETHAKVDEFLRNILPKGFTEKHEAMKSASRSQEALLRSLKKFTSKKNNLANPSSDSQPWTAKDEKKLKDTEKKLAAATEKLVKATSEVRDHEERSDAIKRVREAISHAFSKEGDDTHAAGRTRGMGIAEAEREGAWNPLKATYNPIKLEGWKGTGATLHVSVDRKDGTVDLHLSGMSHDPKFPGEKELHLTVSPRSDKLDRVREETLTAQHPTDTRGKAHPNDVALESKGIGTKFDYHLHDALREHVQKFRTS
jgi:hypothetical protein